MIASLIAAGLLSSFPRYSIQAFPVASGAGPWVEVEGVSANGNVVANLWYGSRFVADDVSNRPEPVLLIGGRVVRIKGRPDWTEATAINDRGQVTLETQKEIYFYDRGNVKKLAFDLPAGQYFEMHGLTREGDIELATYHFNDSRGVVGKFRLSKGMQVSISRFSLPSPCSFDPHDGHLTVDGLPEFNDWMLRQFPNSLSLGYGVHDEYPADGPGNMDKQFALTYIGGKFVPVSSIVDGDLKGIELEDGGYANASGMIAATGLQGGRAAIFILTPETAVNRKS